MYKGAVADLPASLSKHFMGYGDSRVKSLGHGLGFHIDECPVLMAANESPLAAGRVIALEPKCGVKGVGMAGVEESYVMEETGPRCLTGGDRSIVRV